MNIKNILAVRNDRFGEFLLNIPAWRALKQSFPGSRLTLVASPAVSELGPCLEPVDEIISWESKPHRFLEVFRFAGLLRKKNIDLAVIFNPSKEFHWISFLAGIPLRLGYNRKGAGLLTHKIEDRKYLGRKHEIEYNLELVGRIGAKTEDKSLSLRIDNDIINNLRKEFDLAEGQECLVVHPWTSDPWKQWPIENFVLLAERMSRELKRKVLVIGGREEQDRSREFFSRSGGSVVNLTGKTSLVQLAALLKSCRLLISGDSGPVHLASCVATPVVALFRNDLAGKGPVRWGPVSPGSTVIGKPKLSDITIEEVFMSAKRILEP